MVAEGVIRSPSPSRAPSPRRTPSRCPSPGDRADGAPGLSPISAYLYGHELKDAFEGWTPLVTPPGCPEAQPLRRGDGWSLNPHRLIFNKVTGLLAGAGGRKRVPIEDNRLYRVVTGSYCGQMLGTVTASPSASWASRPGRERRAGGGPGGASTTPAAREVKGVVRSASYLRSMGDGGRALVPLQKVKQVIPSWNPVDSVRSPNQGGPDRVRRGAGPGDPGVAGGLQRGRRKRRAYGKGRGRGNGYRPAWG